MINKSEFSSLDDILNQAGIGSNSNATGIRNLEIKVPVSSQIRNPKEVVLISLSDWTTARLIDIEPKVRPLECRCFYSDIIYGRSSLTPQVTSHLKETLFPFAKNYFKLHSDIEQAYIFPMPWCYHLKDRPEYIHFFSENKSVDVIFPELIQGGKSDFNLLRDTYVDVRTQIIRSIDDNLSEIISKRVLFVPFFSKEDLQSRGYPRGVVPSIAKKFYDTFSVYDGGEDIAKLIPVIQQSLWHSSY